MDAMIELLDTLWLGSGKYGCFGELRIISPHAPPEQHFFDLNAPDVLAQAQRVALHYDDLGREVYFGVLPRLGQVGTAAGTIGDTHVLWADVDAKHFDGSKAAALFALGRADLSPSILVDSGNGWHAYWILSERVPFADASSVMRGLAKAIGGDSVHDASRVLRLPGTHNHKTNPPHPVRLLHFEPTRRYRFSDFDGYSPPPVEHHQSVTLEEPLEFADLPDWLQELIVLGAPQGTRSEQAFKVCVWLLRFGWTEPMIHGLFVRNPQGIGEKMNEMKQESGDRWLNRTINAAQEAA